jgi:hypothetical protein
MNTATNIARALAVVSVAAGVAVSSALAGGEPKNVLPFTRALGVERVPALAQPVHIAAAARLVSGELKNELPFTRLAATGAHALTASSLATLPPRGEPKNDVPFTTPA